MTDLYLRAIDQETMEPYLADLDCTIDRIGEAVAYDFTTDPPTQTVIHAYHVNLRGEFTPEQLAALEPVTIPTPAQPYRVFA